MNVYVDIYVCMYVCVCSYVAAQTSENVHFILLSFSSQPEVLLLVWYFEF